MKITNDLLKRLLPDSTEANRLKYLPYFNEYMLQYGINTEKRIAAFIAQIGHESNNLSTVVENLNYSAKRLREVFPKYFPLNVFPENPSAGQKDIKYYANNPERIANRVYANRMGNGNEESGDGWKNRGQGLLQITGAENMAKVEKGTGIKCTANPSLLQQPEWAVKSACWWWKSHGLNEIADNGDFRMITKIINGGYNGWEDRYKLYLNANSVLNIKP